MTCRFIGWLLILLVLLPRLSRAQTVLSDKYRQRAESLYARDKYEEAVVWYEKAYELVCRTDPVRAANLCVDLSSMDYMNHHTRLAADRCLRGLRHISTLKITPDSVRFKLFSSLGTFYKALYRKDSALYYFWKANVLLARKPHIEQQIPLYVLYHFNNQGNWFFKMSNYTRSLLYLDKARKVAEKFGKLEDITFIETNLAGCYDAMGDFDKALIHRFFAYNHYNKVDIQRCVDLSGIGWTLYKLHRYKEAIFYLSEAEQLLVRLRKSTPASKHLMTSVHIFRLISICYRAQYKLEESGRYINRALRLHKYQLRNQGPLLAKVLLEQGELYEDRHRLNLALDTYQEAIRAICRDTTRLAGNQQNPSPETVADEPTLLVATTRKAAVLKKLYALTHHSRYLTESVDTYRFSVDLQQRIRHGIDTDQSQVIFSVRQHTLIPEAIAVTFDAYQQAPALRETLFQFFEQAQAGSLREALRLNIIKPQTIPPHLLEEEQRLKLRISSLKKRSVSDTAATAALTTCQLQWHQLTETFRQNYPAYYRLNYDKATMSSQVLQQHVDNETAYVAYVRRGASLFILVATRHAIRFVRQPIDSARFDQQLAGLRWQLYRDPVLGQYKGATYAAGLYADCIVPIRKYLIGKTRLIICRDWSFNFLPFEVLETGRRSRDYLARHVAIAYAFSAQSFFDVPQRSASTNPVLVVAPFVRGDAVKQAVNRQGTGQPLASSEAEVRNIGGERLLGIKGTLTNFLRTSLHRNVIYLATHAKTDDADPSNSYVMFYPGESDKLYTDDIYNLPLSATGLIVLGACETGSGQTREGEGILSLARAFAYAGCPSVVTTLWKANNETTSFLTIRLHDHLSQGLPIDQALQRARQDFFASPLLAKYDHPFYWANYVLLGKHNPVMTGNTMAVWWLTVLSLVGIALLWQRNRLIHYLKA